MNITQFLLIRNSVLRICLDAIKSSFLRCVTSIGHDSNIPIIPSTNCVECIDTISVNGLITNAK